MCYAICADFHVYVYKSTDFGDTWTLHYSSWWDPFNTKVEDYPDPPLTYNANEAEIIDRNTAIIAYIQANHVYKLDLNDFTYQPIDFQEEEPFEYSFLIKHIYSKDNGYGILVERYNGKVIITKDNWNTFDFFHPYIDRDVYIKDNGDFCYLGIDKF